MIHEGLVPSVEGGRAILQMRDGSGKAVGKIRVIGTGRSLKMPRRVDME